MTASGAEPQPTRSVPAPVLYIVGRHEHDAARFAGWADIPRLNWRSLPLRHPGQGLTHADGDTILILPTAPLYEADRIARAIVETRYVRSLRCRTEIAVLDWRDGMPDDWWTPVARFRRSRAAAPETMSA